MLADQAGQLVNSQELAATLGVAHKTVDEYLYVMRKSYQVAFISPFFRNMRKELVKMPKAYFYDLGLRNFFLGDYSSWKNRADRGACLENIIFRELLKETRGVGKIKFWRTQDQKEVDFVVGKSAYEAKFNSRKQKEGKYAKFQEQYPDIKFSFISNDDLLERFYDFQYEQKSKDR